MLCHLEIPRWICSEEDIEELQLHDLSDASLAVYEAFVYARAIYPIDSVSSHLFCSKSRVAPLKTISLPRFALCEALLLARLVHKVLLFMDLKFKKI